MAIVTQYGFRDLGSEYRLSRRLITDVNSVLGLFHLADLGDVADVSEVHAACIFRVKVCR
jgi:hypothetical protein